MLPAHAVRTGYLRRPAFLLPTFFPNRNAELGGHGVLTKMNVAFSRDQSQKVYVQHKMLQHGADFYHWPRIGRFMYTLRAKTP